MLLHETSAAGVTEYAIVKLNSVGTGDTGVTLRALETGNRRYVVYYNGGSVYWSSLGDESPWTWNEDIQSCSLSFSNGNYLGAKVTGTGTSTVVEVWKYTSAPTAPPSGAADCTFTNNPTTASDTGLKIGLYTSSGAGAKSFDDFAGGGS